MPRTKDLALFVVVVVFLLVAIVVTVFNDSQSSSVFTKVQFSDEGEVVRGANYEAEELDRKSVIERLREAIKNEDDVIVAAVTEPEDSAEEDAEDETSDVPVCEKSGNAIVFASNWPRKGVELLEAEGRLLVAHVTLNNNLSAGSETSDSSASSTEDTIDEPVRQQRNLASLPMFPIKLGEPQCVTSEIVGVTTDGGLLFNSDAIAYRTKTATDLVGYARDGFPIYGNYSGEVDMCGGAEVAGEYRYFLNSADNKVLSCYQGQPQSFVGE